VRLLVLTPQTNEKHADGRGGCLRRKAKEEASVQLRGSLSLAPQDTDTVLETWPSAHAS